ncbi:IclR family transcriptional regulator [Xylophilus sp.]|uniref:IclR family transcriptional regulator n=1 Tax=Xylophilus sp. TaxID=2653893 RepID=UPI0013BDC4AA|nr:IclR family transcriptional regulator [Xylophilus sp.]KAF1049992.1 MAG: Glycerol operon regulatory protein [Xylophilus sp.]
MQGDPEDVAQSPADEDGEGHVSSTSVVSLRILELLAEGDAELGVTQLADMLRMPKARVHRHLTALRLEGYVTQNARTSRYKTGWRLFLLGQKLVRQFDTVGLARPTMEELRDKVGQTIVISTFTDNHVVVLDLVRGRSPLEILLTPGTQYALHTVAQGKIVLAFGDPALLDHLLAAPLAACTPKTIVDPDRLRAEIGIVHKRGWAEAPEEVFMGVNALAAPLFQHGGTLFGTLAIVGSIHFLPTQADPASVEALKDAAAKISGLLGAQAAGSGPHTACR